jgi:hypothetical protein
LKPKPKCLKIVKIWRLHPVLLYFCFLAKRREKSISSAINSSTFSHDLWIRSLLPFEHSGTVGVQPEAMDFTNFTNIKTCSDLFYLYFPVIPSRYHKGRKGGVYTCIPLSCQLKRRIGAWTQFQWKFQMDQIRGASRYVQKCIIPYQLLLLPLWPPYFYELYKTSQIVDRVALSETFLKPVNGCHIKKLSQDLD